MGRQAFQDSGKSSSSLPLKHDLCIEILRPPPQPPSSQCRLSGVLNADIQPESEPPSSAWFYACLYPEKGDFGKCTAFYKATSITRRAMSTPPFV